MSTAEAPSLLSRSDLNDQVYEVVRDWLVSGRLKPREKLSLHCVAEQLGVSRSPVYHALTRLAEEGLVSVQPRRGYYVTPLTQKLVSDAYDIRLALELMAAEQTVGRLDDAQLARLRELGRATLPVPISADTVRAWHKANQALHEYQVDLAGNPTASAIFRRLSVNLLMERALALAGDTGPWLADVHSEHEAIVAAYEAGGRDRVLDALRAHNATGRQIAARALAQLGGSA
ncbi:MAG: GntR family transcriptional regulator [Gaiellaceae bacterium]